VKPIRLPPEAEAQLAEFRALAAEAERVVASAQAQLREIAKQGEAGGRPTFCVSAVLV